MCLCCADGGAPKKERWSGMGMVNRERKRNSVGKIKESRGEEEKKIH